MNSKIVLASRVLLGLVFLVFGANGLMYVLTGGGFIPMPPPPESMMTVMSGFAATKYLMPLVKILEVIAGLLLIIGIYKAAALTMLAPIVVNILGIHLFVDQGGLVMSVVIAVLFLILLKSEWHSFKKILDK